MDFEVTGEITEADVLAANWLHIKPRPVYAVIGIGLAVLSLAVMIISIPHALSGVVEWRGVILLGTGVAALLGWWLAHRRGIVRAYRRQVSLHGDQRLRVTTEGLNGVYAHGDGNTKWPAFIKWKHDGRLILIYMSDSIFIVIPKRWFQPADLNEFTNFLANTIGSSRR